MRIFQILILGLLFSSSVHSRGNLPDFTSLVSASHLAVVNISTRVHKQASESPTSPHKPDEFPHGLPQLEEFLRRFFQQQQDESPRNFDSRSSGSGFIISADGYVLTNNHVVENADEVTVRLTDRRQFIAKVIGTDKRSDIAVLKIEADDDLPFVTTGSAEDLNVGEWVLAIGSPFGFDFSVTAGIVSAKSRTLPNESYVPFIQTDVAINPGNSGGPLFNLKGEVVGINSQIYSRSGGFMGLSFAIPIEIAMEVAEQLKSGVSVKRGWLGVIIQEVTKELAESFGMKKPSGALVSRILPDSPAAASDLKVGDVILSVNGQLVGRSRSLPAIVGRSPLDVPAEVEIFRDGEQKIVSVTIGELPSDEQLMQKLSGKKIKRVEKNANILKIEVEMSDPLKANKGKDKQVESDLAPKLTVTKVEPGPAEDGGIRVGDEIIMISNQSVMSVETFDKAVINLESGRSVPILVGRDNGRVFLAIKIP